MATKGLLDYHSVHLTDSRSAGGTTGALKALDETGARWLVKHYSGNSNRVAAELLANAIYRELDILVPKAGIGRWSGPNREEWVTVAYPMVDGETRRWTEPSETLAEGFVADALVANWDVIGLIQDNILWQGDIPVRIDQGGTFVFRAREGRKPYGPEVVELESMRSEQGQARGRMAINDDLIRRKAADTISSLTSARIKALLSEAPFEEEGLRNEIESSLLARLEHLGRVVNS